MLVALRSIAGLQRELKELKSIVKKLGSKRE